MDLAIVSGAATSPGRFRHAVGVLEQFATSHRDDISVTTIDLANIHVDICDGRSSEEYGQETQRAVRAIRKAYGIILASPVYRASYTGALKNLLDLVPIEALKEKPVGILSMGVSPHHYLGVDSQLRPVLAWFGAVVAPTSVYLTGQDFENGQLCSDKASNDLLALVNTISILAERLEDTELGPEPLAARARS